MKCPVCGGAELIHGARDVPFIYKGHDFTLHNVIGDHCPACGETVMTKEESDIYTAQILIIKKQVNLETIEPGYIIQIRKKLGLNQKEASEIFGGGINAFSRYEQGKAQPHSSTIKLLHVLDRHPDLLSEIRQPSCSKGKTPITR